MWVGKALREKSVIYWSQWPISWMSIGLPSIRAVLEGVVPAISKLTHHLKDHSGIIGGGGGGVDDLRFNKMCLVHAWHLLKHVGHLFKSAHHQKDTPNIFILQRYIIRNI